MSDECKHGCCDACCIACLGTSDNLKESNCYCSHPLCWFYRARLRNRGRVEVGIQEPPVECVCSDSKHKRVIYMIRAVLPRDKEYQLRLDADSGVAAYPTGTKMWGHFYCERCLGEYIERPTIVT